MRRRGNPLAGTPSRSRVLRKYRWIVVSISLFRCRMAAVPPPLISRCSLAVISLFSCPAQRQESFLFQRVVSGRMSILLLIPCRCSKRRGPSNRPVRQYPHLAVTAAALGMRQCRLDLIDRIGGIDRCLQPAVAQLRREYGIMRAHLLRTARYMRTPDHEA